MINLLNCISKIIRKVIAEQLFLYYKIYSKLHQGQIGGQKRKSAIDTMAILVHLIQQKREEKKLFAVFFMNVKEVFDHVSKEHD